MSPKQATKSGEDFDTVPKGNGVIYVRQETNDRMQSGMRDWRSLARGTSILDTRGLLRPMR
jgi:hypothetical protein